MNTKGNNISLPSANVTLGMSPTDTVLPKVGLKASLSVCWYADIGRGRGMAGNGGTFSIAGFSIIGLTPGGRGGGRLLACASSAEGTWGLRRRERGREANLFLRCSGKDDFLAGPSNDIPKVSQTVAAHVFKKLIITDNIDNKEPSEQRNKPGILFTASSEG